jgi:aspartate/methionine/tyrosine aminotransferase
MLVRPLAGIPWARVAHCGMKIAPFALERYFSDREFSVPYLLSSSDSESMTLGDLLAFEPGAADELGRLWLGYTEYNGHPLLRERIAELYDGVGPEHIMVHSGAQEAIHNFMLATLEPGDHAIVHFPGYQSLYSVAEAIGCDVTRWPGDWRRGWELDVEFLEANLRPSTRLVVINCPHNPTGYTLPRAAFDRVIELSQKHGFILFSDEVYRLAEYQPEDRLPAAASVDERAVSLGVMSKSFGLAGLRIGWVATRNRDVFDKMAARKDYTTICNAAPSEFLASLALRHRDRILRRNVDIITANLELARAFFDRHDARFEWLEPRAGPIAFPRVREGSADELCRQLEEHAGVLLLPGSIYDATYAAHFRVGLGRSNFAQGLARLEAHL